MFMYLFMKCIDHSTETVLCFRESRFVFPCVVKCCLVLCLVYTAQQAVRGLFNISPLGQYIIGVGSWVSCALLETNIFEELPNDHAQRNANAISLFIGLDYLLAVHQISGCCAHLVIKAAWKMRQIGSISDPRDSVIQTHQLWN